MKEKGIDVRASLDNSKEVEQEQAARAAMMMMNGNGMGMGMGMNGMNGMGGMNGMAGGAKPGLELTPQLQPGRVILAVPDIRWVSDGAGGRSWGRTRERAEQAGKKGTGGA